MAAKGYADTARQSEAIIKDVRNGVFSSVYLLMGEEPYYPELVCSAIIENALDEAERDFNETICYGSEVDADTVITAARRYPMMAERQLVVVKEAQSMKDLDDLAVYCKDPLDSTVFVICLHGAKVDKRKQLYSNALKNGVVLESPLLRDYEVSRWINSYYSGRGLEIEPEAAELLAESAGTDLGKIAVETDKLLKNVPEGTVKVTVADIERNVGVSRMFSAFELTKALSFRDAPKALRLSARIGQTPKFFLPMTISALFLHFYRVLRYEAFLKDNPRPSRDDKVKVLGVPPFLMGEYDAAVSNYPLERCMGVISLLCDYDYLAKGGDGGPARDGGELLEELTAKILSC